MQRKFLFMWVSPKFIELIKLKLDRFFLFFFSLISYKHQISQVEYKDKTICHDLIIPRAIF